MGEGISKGDRIRVTKATFSSQTWSNPGDLGTVVWRMEGSENYPPGTLQIKLDNKFGVVSLTEGEVEKISSASTTKAPSKKATLPITPREREVLIELCQGKNGPEIAEAMGIKPHGVRLHLNSIYKKTGTRNRTELALRIVFGCTPTEDFIAYKVHKFIEDLESWKKRRSPV